MKIYADLSSKVSSNCYTQGRDGRPVLVLVCHNTAGPGDFNTAGQSAATAQQLSDQAANYLTNNDRQVSIHWLVGAEACGAPIYRIVPETDTAYHCGGSPPQFPSHWLNPDDNQAYGRFGLNQVAIGIELFGQVTDTVGPNQLASLQALVQDIASRHPILRKVGHIVAHKVLEGDRQDGANWVEQARSWLSGGVVATPTSTTTGSSFQVIPISYKVTVPSGRATVRSGPGRSYSIVGTLPPDSSKVYQVDGEAHGEAIPDPRQPSGSDDTWAHLPEANGFVSRTAISQVS